MNQTNARETGEAGEEAIVTTPPYLEEGMAFTGLGPEKEPMSLGAYKLLLETRGETSTKLWEWGQALGQAGEGADFHDNFAFDEAMRQIELSNTELLRFIRLTEAAVIVPPRQLTDKVGIGNAVVLAYSETEIETYLVLGEVDYLYRGNVCLSWASPVGRSILGKSAGCSVQVGVNGSAFVVKILDILPGNF